MKSHSNLKLEQSSLSWAWLIGLTTIISACSTPQLTSPVNQAPPVTFSSPPTVTGTSTPNVTPAEALNLKVAYVAVQPQNTGSTSQLWILEAPYKKPRNIPGLDKGISLFNSEIAWSHNGQYIAYTTITNSNTSIHVVNVATLDKRDIGTPVPPQLFGPESGSSIKVRPNAWSLADKWLATTLRYSKETYGDIWDKTVFYNLETGAAIELAETYLFVAWSPTDPDQFLYIEQPNYPDLDNQIVHVGRVGQVAPISSIGLSHTYVEPWISWSPNGGRVLAVSPSVNPAVKDKVISFDLPQSQWKEIAFNSQRSELQTSLWSPDGRILAIWQGMKLCLWQVDSTNPAGPCVAGGGLFLAPMLWTPDSRQLLFQQGLQIFTMDTQEPQTKTQIVDLSDLIVENTNTAVVFYGWLSGSH